MMTEGRHLRFTAEILYPGQPMEMIWKKHWKFSSGPTWHRTRHLLIMRFDDLRLDSRTTINNISDENLVAASHTGFVIVTS